jgi:soluble lytic murein transglycosylase
MHQERGPSQGARRTMTLALAAWLGLLPTAVWSLTPGLTLRAALQAEAAGDLAQAEALLDEAGAYPEIGDYADLLRVRVLLAADRPNDAVVVAEWALARHPKSPLVARLFAGLGDAYVAAGAEPAARDAFGSALQLARDPAERAELLLALAESQARDGNDAAAAARYREIWRGHPTRSPAEEAERELVALEALPDVPARTTRDWLDRADALYAAHDNEAALAVYDRVLAERPAARTSSEALKGRAAALFRLRRYPEAVQAYERLGRASEARIQRARALARAGRVPEGVEALEQLAGERRGSASERARYIAALLLDDEEPRDPAIRHFRVLARSARSGSIRRDAYWRLGWAAYGAGDLDEAAGQFAVLETLHPAGLPRLQARYWRARALERADDPRARDLFVGIASEYPLSYYGWRAAQRAGGSELPGSLAGELSGRNVQRLQPRELARVRALVAAGLHPDARIEVKRLAAGRLSLDDRIELARLASDAGDPHRAERLVVDAYQDELAQGPRPGYEELWWLAWPWLHAEALNGAAGQTAPELVYGVMREESGFRPEVVSPVGARGLLQIMPETGERLARDLGLDPFTPDDLFDPRINVQLGAHYLSQLEARFAGRRSAAVGSYNAGPEAIARWIDADGHLDDDEWVESIPYGQTRTYVKRVLRSVYAYQVLY